MLETYFLDDYLGYIFLHKELSKCENILLDSLGEVVSVMHQDEEEIYETGRFRAFLGKTPQEARIQAHNWFNSRRLNIYNLRDWYTTDRLKKERVFNVSKLIAIPKSGKYLVQSFNSLGEDILVTVYQVLELVESQYGTIIVARTNSEGSWENQCFFLNEALEQNYIFSNDEKYKDWVNQ